MKRLPILVAALTSAAPVVSGAAILEWMSPADGPSCVAAICLAISGSAQPVAMTVAGLSGPEATQGVGAMVQAGLVAVASPGGGQGAAGAVEASAGGMQGGSGAAATAGTGAGTTPGASSSGGKGRTNSGSSGTGPGGAVSQPTLPGGAPNDARPPVSESDAARHVQQSIGGRILDVKPDNAQGRLTYRVKVLSDSGEVRVITIDAQTGERE